MPEVPAFGGPAGPRERPPGSRPTPASADASGPPAARPAVARVRDQRRPPRRARRGPDAPLRPRRRRPLRARVFTVALSVQIQLEPIQRRYDHETRERLEELFGEPEPVGDHGANAASGARVRARPELLRLDLGRSAGALQLRPRAGGDPVLQRAADGEVPLVCHFNGSVYYQGDDGRLQIAPIPWDTVADYQMPVAAWREMIDSHYPHRGWVALDADDGRAPRPAQGRPRQPHVDQTVERAARRGGGP